EGPAAVDLLIAFVKEEKYEGPRIAAAEGLARLGTPGVEALVACLKDPNKGVRWSAALALSTLGDTRAVEPLVAWLKDEDENMRARAAEALRALKYEPATPEARVAFLIAKQDWKHVVLEGDAAVAPMIACLKDLDERVREAAAETLGKLGPSAVDPLIACLKDKNESVRKAAAQALKQLGYKPEGVEPSGN
ncbi:MAG: HEAT repeat domain-containing protein, partial [Candidatus Hydrogenedentes bacterium]|nr:HEAT repeat domain-containing protein [Candidatus Hydrogenedentota bacterium]